MSWHENFEGTERQFEDYVGIWHDDNCGENVEFSQFANTNWMICDAGRHTFWTDGETWWCRPFMVTYDRVTS